MLIVRGGQFTHLRLVHRGEIRDGDAPQVIHRELRI